MKHKNIDEMIEAPGNFFDLADADKHRHGKKTQIGFKKPLHKNT